MGRAGQGAGQWMMVDNSIVCGCAGGKRFVRGIGGRGWTRAF